MTIVSADKAAATSEVGAEILAFLQIKRDRLVQIGLAAMEAAPNYRPNHDSRRQLDEMVESFLAMLTEQVVHGTRESIDFYHASVIPAIVRSGIDVSVIAHGAVMWAVLVAHELARDPAMPETAGPWLANYFARNAAEACKVAMTVQLEAKEGR